MSCKHTRANPARAVLILGLIAALAPPVALAQQAQQGEAAAANDQPQTVLVTGTRSLNRRTLDSESPVDVIGSKELSSTGSGELATVLSRLLPSMNFPRPSGADASDAVRPAQLRGLSPDQTLVLVNGKRRHASSVVNVNGTLGRGSAPVDLNAIPLAAIDHIEVLRDGAAAQYGSDAIAGVVNIILKKGAKGGEAEVVYGQYDKGDGEQATVRGSAGFDLGNDGWVRVAVEAADRNATNRAFADPRPSAGPRQGTVTQRYGDPDSRPRALFVNSQVRVNDAIDWYAFANYGERKTSSAATFRTAYTDNNRTTLRSPLYPEGFQPLLDSKSVDAAIVTGLRGDLAGWRWDASLNHGRNRFSLDVANTVNYSLGSTSPTRFYAGELTSTQSLANLDVAREIPVAFMSGPLTVALGAEARFESYEIGAGEANSYFGSGAQGYSGFRSENAGENSRSNKSLYLNLEGEITKELSGALALRHERYSDFGTTNSAKASARYAFTPTFALRGTASNGFRAPSLAQSFYTITTTNSLLVNGASALVETGTFPVGSAAARALGARPLEAEKARNLSIGAQWQPTRNWTTTVDLYRIDVDDRIVFSSNLQLANAPALASALAAQGVYVGAARYFTNAVDTRTQGVDVVSTYRLNLRPGTRADLTLAYNHNDNEVQHVADTPAVLAAQNLVLVDRQSVNRLTVGSPKDKLSLSGDLTQGAWNARAAVTRYGKFTVPQNDAALDQNYDPQWVLDLAASVRVGDGWRLSAGIDNVTNRYPAQVTSLANLNVNGTQPYSVWAPNGFNGRYFYLKAGYSW
ncbi:MULTISPECIES: TonB-dependent siderophore receptor [unclassified Massilia]|uniref:TonB-dependent receptor plug domain-containing protein n=1 Tax=unclassified Massilia TaxID=2609279 RepID=UPI00178576F5|nr:MULTISPECIES: TonB-dependent receptor [unclassified Massilia]MBD8528397.1 TonB-dependent receptor [Massilia sp. CFBP 13647]MBD8671981.1 TonB-dependent receptor [Massilia sp. CFBP 13721]